MRVLLLTAFPALLLILALLFGRKKREATNAKTKQIQKDASSDDGKSTYGLAERVFLANLGDLKVIPIDNLEYFSYHLFRTSRDVPASENASGHYLLQPSEDDKELLRIHPLHKDKKERFKAQDAFRNAYRDGELITFCIDDTGSRQDSDSFQELLENIEKDKKEKYLEAIAAMLKSALSEMYDEMEEYDLIACFWHIGQISKEGHELLPHLHFICRKAERRASVFCKVQACDDHEE